MKNIKAKIILEIAGYPEKHVEETMNKVIEKIKEDSSLKLEEKEQFPLEEKDDMFATFTELLISFESILNVYEFCFNYMPSSIDVVEPSDVLMMDASDFNNSINDLIATIHQHDAFLKNSNANFKVLNTNMNKLLLNFVSYLTKEKKEIPEMEKIIGIDAKKIDDFVKEMKKLKGENGKL